MQGKTKCGHKYVSGKEDEKLWEIILDLDLLIKAGRDGYQDSVSQMLNLSLVIKKS